MTGMRFHPRLREVETLAWHQATEIGTDRTRRPGAWTGRALLAVFGVGLAIGVMIGRLI